MDAAKNFAKGTLQAGIDDTETEVTLGTGEGLRFPEPNFNAVIWNVTDFPDPADDPNVEIVRVTAIDNDTLTITRAQEGTAAAEHNSDGKSYQLIAGLTLKTLVDILPSTRTGDDYDLQLPGILQVTAPTVTIVGGAAVLKLDNAVAAIGDVEGNNTGAAFKADDNSGQTIITTQPLMPDLPSSNPNIAGALYYDAGTGNVKRSAG